MGYEIRNNLHKGYCDIIKSNRSKYSFDDCLVLLKIDLDNYWILKKTRKYKFLTINELEKYSGVIFFEKKKYKKEDIEKWLRLYNSIAPYLNTPFPPVEIIDKIKVVK